MKYVARIQWKVRCFCFFCGSVGVKLVTTLDVFTFYHVESPLNHHLREYDQLVPSIEEAKPSKCDL